MSTIAVRIDGANLGKTLGAHWEEAQEAGAWAAGELWHGRYLEKHFTSGGQRAYGYSLRVLGYRYGTEESTSVYEGWERTNYRTGRGIVTQVTAVPGEEFTVRRGKGRRLADGQEEEQRGKFWLLGVPYKPLVKSGAMRAAARGGIRPSRRTKKRTVLVMDLPDHAYIQNKRTQRPVINKAEEVYRVTDAEAAAMVQAWATAVGEKLATVGRAA